MAYGTMSSAAVAAAGPDLGPSRRRTYMKRFESLKGERLTFDQTWKQLAEVILTRRTRFLLTDKLRPGVRKDDDIINCSPAFASRVLAAGMNSGLTSKARPWFQITTPDPDLAQYPAVKQWLSTTEDRIRQGLARSNIYKELSNTYVDLGTFGTNCFTIEEDPLEVLRAYPVPLGSYCLATDDRGVVDTLYRETGLTVRQLVRKFGLNRASTGTRQLFKNGQLDVFVDVLHIIEPRDERSGKKGDPRNMRWKSCWLEMVKDDRTPMLGELGYEEFPALCSRWEKTGEDVYGSSPGMLALGDARALQRLERRKLQLVDKLANPPMRVPASLRAERVSFGPGDVNYVDAVQNGQAMAPAVEMDGQALPAINEVIREHQARIRTAYFADLWLMLAQQDNGPPEKTAREIAERHEEKMLQLGPVIENLEDELLDPLINRVFNILLRAGYIPPAPRELGGSELRIEYISIMAQAQKMLGLANVDRLLGTVGNMAGVEKTVLDNINFDKVVRVYADMAGVPPEIIRTDAELEKVRRIRAQQAMQQQQAAQAAQAVQGAQVLSQTDMQGDNALTRLVNNYGPSVAAAAGRPVR